MLGKAASPLWLTAAFGAARLGRWQIVIIVFAVSLQIIVWQLKRFSDGKTIHGESQLDLGCPRPRSPVAS